MQSTSYLVKFVILILYLFHAPLHYDYYLICHRDKLKQQHNTVHLPTIDLLHPDVMLIIFTFTIETDYVLSIFR